MPDRAENGYFLTFARSNEPRGISNERTIGIFRGSYFLFAEELLMNMEFNNVQFEYIVARNEGVSSPDVRNERNRFSRRFPTSRALWTDTIVSGGEFPIE